MQPIKTIKQTADPPDKSMDKVGLPPSNIQQKPVCIKQYLGKCVVLSNTFHQVVSLMGSLMGSAVCGR